MRLEVPANFSSKFFCKVIIVTCLYVTRGYGENGRNKNTNIPLMLARRFDDWFIRSLSKKETRMNLTRRSLLRKRSSSSRDKRIKTSAWEVTGNVRNRDFRQFFEFIKKALSTAEFSRKRCHLSVNNSCPFLMFNYV